MSTVQVIPDQIQNVLNMPIQQIRNWSLKYTGQDIRVEGFVSTDDGNTLKKVTSEALVRRISATALFDRAGTFFELIGPIDHHFQQKGGMKKDLINEFSDGFPENWGLLLDKCSTVSSIESTPSATKSISSSFSQPVQKGPIVTLADETNSTANNRPTQQDVDKEQFDPANSTFRAPSNCQLDAITPIRWDKTKSSSKLNSHNVFEPTPARSSRAPLASSTPQPPPIQHHQQQQPHFAVPELPVVDPLSRINSVADAIGDLFEETTNVRTPAAFRKSRSRYDNRAFPNESRRSNFFNERDDASGSNAMNRKRAYSSGRSYSPEWDIPSTRHRRMDDDDWERRSNYHDRDDRSRKYRRDFDESRQSSSSRSVRFKKEDEYSKRRNESSSMNYVQSDRTLRELGEVEDHYLDLLSRVRKDQQPRESRKNSSQDRQPRGSRKNSSQDRQPRGSRKNSSQSDSDRELAKCWEQENQRILDESISEDRKKRTTGKFKEPIKKEKRKAPARRPKTPESDQDDEREELESPNISQRRPMRNCRNTPIVTPQPKKVVWNKKELDKLKRIINVKKPSGSENDWKEVSRLLNSRNSQVDWNGIKQIAIDKSLWKEPKNSTQPEISANDLEEEEEKRRKGVAAAVKEDKRLREQMIGSRKNKDLLAESVESVENIEPEDISADESFFATTPVVITEAIRRKGGTRKSLVPNVVVDTPVRSVNSSVDQTPKPDATMAKDNETTMKYVHQLVSMKNRPGSRANQSVLNNTKSRNNTTFSGKNTSISVAKGAQKAMRMVQKDVLEEEDDEEESSNEEGSSDDE